MKFKFTLIVLFLSQLVISQDGIMPNPEVLKTEWEDWVEEVPISGNIRVGLMIEKENPEKLSPKQFYANIPKNTSGVLCVEISSKDGRYSAKLNYTIDKSISGLQKFILPTQYEKALREFSTDEVVILASLSEDCSIKPDAYVLSSWNKPDDYNQAVYVYVNLIASTTLVYEYEKENTKTNEVERIQSEASKCESLNDPLVAYNKKCKIPFSYNDYKNSSRIYIISKSRRGSMIRKNEYKLFVKIDD